MENAEAVPARDAAAEQVMQLSLFKKGNDPDIERMSDKKAEDWSLEREKGQFQWILKRSLVYGVIGFSIWGLLSWLLNLDSRLSLFWLIFSIASELGICFSLWDQKEEKYWQYIKDKALTEPPKESFLNYDN